MSVLAQATPAELEDAAAATAPWPAYTRLRGPEVGLVMVRARAGGTGMRFNLGEMTVTRVSVEMAGGRIGHAYVAGRCPRQAEVAAVLDGLLQDPARAAAIESAVVEPLADRQEARRRAVAARAAATRVEFFTVVRGED
jgi:alpha-D-ribose 1-methylphosphonate 5-triphosphate synthase subunit PhnG